MKKLKKKRLPKSPRALGECIQGLTRRILKLRAHFQNPANSHDASQRRLLAQLVERRGRALEALEPLDSSLHQTLINQIKQGGQCGLTE